MVQVVENLRLTHRDATVRSICAQIPAPVRLLADGREEEFRNRYRLTYPIPHDAHRLVWQIERLPCTYSFEIYVRLPTARFPAKSART
jgi:hypothetical protein